jgi:hypothetical protein
LEIQNPESKIQNQPFDWRIYADATCAGLSVLIPLPLVDIVFEVIFRRRIPGAISRARQLEIAPDVRAQLGKAVGGPLSLTGCFSVFFAAGRYLLKRIWRKIIYFLAMKDAANALSEYWHRAFLIDHMARAGHLEPGVDTDLAVGVFNRTLLAGDPSPLTGLARLTIANAHHVLRLLVRARRLGAAEVTRSLGELLSLQWQPAQASMEETATLYNRLYAAAVNEMTRSREAINDVELRRE